MTISPKALAAFLVPIVAAVALWQITGDKTFLITILIGLATGGTAVALPPAPKVTQREVADISKRRR